MPELPEVETVKRGLEPVMTGQILSRVELRRADLRIPFPANLPKLLEGHKILRLSRRAKYLFVHLSNDKILIIHLGMSGKMIIIKNMQGYEPLKHDHMILHIGKGTGVVFNDPRRFGMVMLMDEAEMTAHSSFAPLGPEPLADEFTGEVLRERLARKSMPIKLALLDQHIVAGVGNIYASEALSIAGISPLRKSSDISTAKAEKLVNAIKDVLLRAIEAGGSSLKDHRQADGNLGYFQHSFSVYDRAGEPCPRCKGGVKKKSVIQKIMQSGRATYYCPSCQK